MTARQPVAYGYARASHASQYEKKLKEQGICDSVDGQDERIQSIWKTVMEPRGVVWGGLEADDKPVSAFKVPFLKREAAIRLMNKVQRGDFIIIDKIDRLWRRIDDFVDLDRTLETRGIHLYIGNFHGLSMDTSLPMGKWLLKLLVLCAELESINTSNRIKDNFARRKALGLKVSRYSPKLTKHVQKGPHMAVVEDKEARTYAAEIVRLRDEENMSFLKIAIAIQRMYAEANGLKFKRPKFLYEMEHSRYQWNMHSCMDAYAAEKMIRAKVAGENAADAG